MLWDTKPTAKDATGATKYRQIQILCDPKPMEYIPDQESAKNHGDLVETLCCLPEQSWDNVEWCD